MSRTCAEVGSKKSWSWRTPVLRLINIIAIFAGIYFSVNPLPSHIIPFFLVPTILLLNVQHVAGIITLVLKLCIKPILRTAATDHATCLEDFYHRQAKTYDDSRVLFLDGREQMLALCIAELNHQMYINTGANNNNSTKPLIWIDIGSGTGWLIERMNAIFPIKNFDRVYSVDITPSLSKIAEERFERLGWSNVTVICDDATTCKFPGLKDPEGKATLVTMSYSLSMMQNIYQIVDRIQCLLNPSTGIVGVSDFGISKLTPTVVSTRDGLILQSKSNWFAHWFWQVVYSFYCVHFHPSLRDYMQHKFSTIKSHDAFNSFRVPYYVWVGARHKTANLWDSNELYKNEFSTSMQILPRCGPTWRLPYDPTSKCHNLFKSYLFGFTWEDPREDLKILNLNAEDEILVITSAGDNVLNYLCHSNVKKIHSVDLNQYQNNLLELKLASISALTYEEFWQLFGKGRFPGFSELLDEKLSPWLSASAYNYWNVNAKIFNSNFYVTGGSGLALQLIDWIKFLFRMKSGFELICKAETSDEQERIYRSVIRPVFLHPWLAPVIDNPVFLWAMCGVPKSQRKMMEPEGSFYDYACDTLDPAFTTSSFLKDDQYFYRLLLLQEYSRTCCPEYLTESGFNRLKTTNALGALSIHTDYISNVLKRMADNSLTKAVLMDHLDWMDQADMEDEVQQLQRVLKIGGMALFRSCARMPWYKTIFEANGFQVNPISIRQPGSGIGIDRVNMYASFYQVIKI